MTQEQIASKMLSTAKELKYVKKNNKKLRSRLAKAELTQSSHDSIKAIFDSIDDDQIPSEMADLWRSQRRYLKLKDKRGMKWPYR